MGSIPIVPTILYWAMLCNWLTRQPLKLKFPVRVWVVQQIHCCREELLHKMLIRTICQKILLSSVT